MSGVEKHEAMHEVAIRHEYDCGKPGVFAQTTYSEDGVWAFVIERFDPNYPLKKVGKPCKYLAQRTWHIARTERDQ